MIYNGVPLRHELKYYIPEADLAAMRGRVAAVLRPDEHAGGDGCYHVRSLYFDDPAFTDVWEKESGAGRRAKTRVRVYNRSPALIRFERKIKVDAYVGKQSAPLTRKQLEAILGGETSFLLRADSPVLHRFYADYKLRRLRPAVIADYEREAYTLREGGVRVTFDRKLTAAAGDWNLFSDDGLIFHYAYPPQMLTMEVKFDGFLPDAVKRLIRPYTARRAEISKYILCVKAIRQTYARLAI
ncbi:MAG: polyphosphate polymerase domain-containing protein [Oscillospiraceae bacterium]|nr:polyphosphate polymerase domain-containing protein [Oscillospiraceae bacterium]